MSNYYRVLPRDLFNEANLLKCMGKITCMVHDEQIQGLTMEHHSTLDGFKVIQNISDGSITLDSVSFHDEEGEPVYFYTSMNSRDAYPLVMQYKECEYFPLNEKGEYQLSATLFLRGEAVN